MLAGANYSCIIFLLLCAWTESYPQSSIRKADKAFNDQRYGEALQLFLTAENNEDADITFKTAYCKMVLHDYHGAIPLFELTLKNDSSFFDTYYYLGICKLKTNSADEALPLLQRALHFSQGYRQHYSLGEAYRITKNYEGCVRSASAALKSNPADSIYFLRSECKALLGEHRDAIVDLDYAIEKTPSNPLYLYRRGILKLETSSPEGSIVDLTRAIELASSTPDYYFERGRALAKLNRNAEALRDFERSISLGKRDDASYFLRGRIKEALGALSGAIADYTIAIEINPESASYYFARAETKSKNKDKAGAIEDFQKYLHLVPGDVVSYLNIAEAALMLGQADVVEANAEKALGLSRKTRYRALSLFFLCCARNGRGQDVAELEQRLSKTLEESFSLSWSFTDLELSIRSSSVPLEHRNYILYWISRMNQK